MHNCTKLPKFPQKEHIQDNLLNAAYKAYANCINYSETPQDEHNLRRRYLILARNSLCELDFEENFCYNIINDKVTLTASNRSIQEKMFIEWISQTESVIERINEMLKQGKF